LFFPFRFNDTIATKEKKKKKKKDNNRWNRRALTLQLLETAIFPFPLSGGTDYPRRTELRYIGI